jgi:hypothetical protein
MIDNHDISMCMQSAHVIGDGWLLGVIFLCS